MTGKLHVLTVVAGLAIGQQGGGAERFGVELACSLDRSVFDPVVCGFWRRRLPVEEVWLQRLTDAGIPAFFAADRGERFSLPAYYRGLERIVERVGGAPIDIIHSHYQLGSVAGPYLRRRLGAKALVRTAHGPVFHEWGRSVTGSACRLLFTKVLYPITFDAEAGVSQQIVESLDRRLVARVLGKKALLLHNAIALHKPVGVPDVAKLRAELVLPPESTVVGSIGRLAEQKGYRYLLEAIPVVLASRSDVSFVLIGDGELRSSLEAIAARLALTGRLVFAGLRPNAERYCPAMDLFVLPSIWEGLPTVVLESMASGIPVVATDLPGTRELITPGRTGWLVRANDPADLARGILEALANPSERAAMAAAALTSVVPRFSIAHIARHYEMLYDRLTGRAAA